MRIPGYTAAAAAAAATAVRWSPGNTRLDCVDGADNEFMSGTVCAASSGDESLDDDDTVAISAGGAVLLRREVGGRGCNWKDGVDCLRNPSRCRCSSASS